MEIINPSKAAVARRGKAAATTPPANAEHLCLERVYGSGSCAGTVVAEHPVVPGLLAYSSGSTVVLYDSVRKQQQAFFGPKASKRSAGTGKPYTSLAFSRDGAYLAAGERGDQSPEILIWEVSSSRCLQALRGHKHGVSSVAFCQHGRLLVSTGDSYDGQLCVWDWQAGTLLAKQHMQGDVARACVSEEGTASATITTVGKSGHFKVWTLANPTGRSGSASLSARPVNLKEYRTSSFVGAVAAGGAPPLLYALTSSGVLLTVAMRTGSRSLDKSVNLQVPAAYALAASSKLVACACAAGVVRLFEARTLAFKGNLPRHSARTGGGHAGAEGTPGGLATASAANATAASASSLFPDALGAAFDCSGERLTVVYADRSILVWDVRNPSKVLRARSILSHSGIVWGAAIIPAWQAPLLGASSSSAPTPGGGSDVGPATGPSSVLCTCGTDGTVRLWNICLDNSASTAGPTGVPADAAGAAKVTRSLRAIIHVTGPAEAAATSGGHRRFAPDAPLPGSSAQGAGAAKPVSLRCLRVSPCGRHLATGDSKGNLRVFSLSSLQLLLLREAHDAEIRSLDYSPPSVDGTCYLASGGKDALIHVYDTSRSYELVGTCDAHSATVTAVRFSTSGGRLALLSCSADKSVVFRRVQLGPAGLSFQIYQTERMSRAQLFDLAVDPAGGRAVAVGQGAQLRLFDVATGRAIRNIAGDPALGEPVSVQMDPTGSLAVCSCADGSVAVYDVDAGALMARGSGHSEMCTGAALLEDHRGLVTVGGDGCALLWRLTPVLTQRMHEAAAQCRRQIEAQMAAQAAARQREVQERQEQEATPALERRKAWGMCDAAEAGAEQVHVDLSATMMRLKENKPILSIDKLPRWAQRMCGYEGNAVGDTPAAPPPQPAGKWAVRMAPPEPEPAAAPSAAVAASAGPVAAPAPALSQPKQQPEVSAPGAEHREWAVWVEEDEVLYCDSDVEEEAGLAAFDSGAGKFAVQEGCEAKAACRQETDDTQAEPRTSDEDAGSGRALEQDQAQGGAGEQDGADEQAPEEPVSACASNFVGASEPEAQADLRPRDLFKEHFDGLDQGSTSKPPAPDPRRQSLSMLFRLARGAGTAAAAVGGGTAAAAAAGVPPISPPRLPPAPAAGASTPLLARMPLPAAINVTRGAATAEVDNDGAITSAAWTPERAMLPLTSPVLANTDKQLRELERMRERLANSLRKGPTKAEPAKAAAQAAAPAPVAAPAGAVGPACAAAAAVTSAAAARECAALCEPVRATESLAVPTVHVQPKQKPHVGDGSAVAVVPAAGSSRSQSREGAAVQPGVQATSSGITFAPSQPVAPAALEPLPVAATTTSPRAVAHSDTQDLLLGQLPHSPGFSALSNGTPWLGRDLGVAPAGPALTPAAPLFQPGGGQGPDAARAEGLLVYNPIFGATPGTPVLGLAVARPLGSGSDAPAAAAQNAGPADAAAAAAAFAGAPLMSGGDSAIGDVLEQAADGTLDPTGVCVVRRGSGEDAASKRTQQAQPGPVVAQEAAASTKASVQPTVAAASSPARRRPKSELPVIRGSPVKAPQAHPQSATAVAASALLQTQGAAAAGADAPGPESEAASGRSAAQAAMPDTASVSCADALSRMQDALRGFASAYRRLHSATPASASYPAEQSGSSALAQQYREAAEGAVAELTALLSGNNFMLAPGPGADSASAFVARPLDASAGSKEGTSVPEAAACTSPRVPSQDARSGQPVLSTGSAAPVATAASALVGGELTSSQVVLEVGLMESMVEEKVQQRMKEELRRVEETIMQRIMQNMRVQPQSAKTD